MFKEQKVTLILSDILKPVMWKLNINWDFVGGSDDWLPVCQLWTKLQKLYWSSQGIFMDQFWDLGWQRRITDTFFCLIQKKGCIEYHK